MASEVKLTEAQRIGLARLSMLGRLTTKALLPNNPRGGGMVAKALVSKNLAAWRWADGPILPLVEITLAGRAALKKGNE